MNLLRAIFIVIEMIIIAGIFCMIGMDIKPLEKFGLIVYAIMMMGMIYIICDVIGWNIWKRKCDKELKENLKKIDREYWAGYLDCVNIYDIKIKKRKGYNFKI